MARLLTAVCAKSCAIQRAETRTAAARGAVNRRDFEFIRSGSLLTVEHRCRTGSETSDPTVGGPSPSEILTYDEFTLETEEAAVHSARMELPLRVPFLSR